MRWRTLLALTVLAGGTASALAEGSLRYDRNALTKVEMLYGIDEDAAITRLTKEYDAAVQARTIPERHLVGFGGARFDADTQGLVVATNQTADFDGIRRAGAEPTLVNPYGSKTMQRTFSCPTKPIP